MHLGILGAGAIGCYVGGRLARAGTRVTFVGRARGQAEVARAGLVLDDLDGSRTVVPPDAVDYRTDPSVLTACDVVLVTVKSGQTRDAGASIAALLPRGALVVSLQNGVHNADVLRAAMPDHQVLAGIVGFNVVARDDGSFRLGTTGPIAIEDASQAHLGPLAAALRRAGFETELARDIRGKQWSKLVVNLANALGAVSGAPTHTLVFDAAYRRSVRAVMGEALAVLRAAGIRPARLGPLPVRLFPAMLALPTPLFAVAARAQLRIDPEARSSMWQDLDRGRRTEVEELNGAIVRLGRMYGAPTPVNERLVALVHEAEAGGKGSPKLSAEALWRALHR